MSNDEYPMTNDEARMTLRRAPAVVFGNGNVHVNGTDELRRKEKAS